MQDSYGYVAAEEETTATEWAGLDTPGPTTTITVGESGRAVVFGGAYVTSSDTNQTVVAGVKVDDGETIDLVALSNNTGGSIGGDLSSSFPVDGLDAGEHTFTFQYKQTLPDTVGRFGSRWIRVTSL